MAMEGLQEGMSSFNLEKVASIGGGLSQLDWMGFVYKAIYAFIFAIFLVMVIKYMTFRVQVKIFEVVNEGYVMTKKRYRIKKDKTNKEFLQPMFGKNKLPSFPFESFQFVNGMPFFGIKRSISIIKLNEYTFKVLYPFKDGKVGEVAYYSTLSWVFMEQYAECQKKFNKQSILYWLSIAAPSIVILAMAFLLFAGMITDSIITKQSAEAIGQWTQIFIKMCEANGCAIGG